MSGKGRRPSPARYSGHSGTGRSSAGSIEAILLSKRIELARLLPGLVEEITAKPDPDPPKEKP